MSSTEFPKCPRCDHFIPSDERPGEYPGALSRTDNHTEVCSDCGSREAMEQFFMSRNGGIAALTGEPREWWIRQRDQTWFPATLIEET